MKDLSVSHFKATIAASLREVQAGETLIITEHRRPIAEIRAYGADSGLIVPASAPFSLAGTAPKEPVSGVWASLLDGERGEH
jgi:antitoxin (DNA-binding transcriptional repressor) of toxin-antitoxin stability system